jgi:hypothetical protein
MIYNASNLKAMLDSGDIDAVSWRIHFAGIPDSIVPACNDCLDWKGGICSKEGDPIECFLYGLHSPSNGILLKKPNAK